MGWVSDIPIVGAAVNHISEATVGALSRGIGYILYYKYYVDKLKSKISKGLHAKEQDIEIQVERAKNNGKTIKEHVVKWQGDVDVFKGEVTESLGKYEGRSSWKCFNVLRCPNPYRRFQLGRWAAKKTTTVSEFSDLEKKQLTGEISYFPPTEYSPISSTEYQIFGSREVAYQKILNALKYKEDGFPVVGVYGFGGVGKTRMMEEASKEVKAKGIFKTVARANVGQVVDGQKVDMIGKIQDQLATYLDITERSEDRTSQLKARLSKGDTILVILDDVWSEIPFTEIEIGKNSHRRPSSTLPLLLISGGNSQRKRGGERDMGSEGPVPIWASQPCIMGIDEAGRGPVLGPMVYGCLYCAISYQETLSSLNFADSKTLKEEKREELFENLKADESIGWAVDVIDPKELSAKMLKKNKINLNEISHDSAMGLVRRALNMGILLTEVYVDTVGDPEKYRIKLSEIFPSIKFVVAKKADSLYPVVSGASIVAKVTRDRALRDWVLDESAEKMHRKYGSGYPGDPKTKGWLEDHKHSVFGFPTLVRFSWGTCNSYFKDGVEVLWESDATDEDGSSTRTGKRQLKLSSVGFTGLKRKSENIESSGKGLCKFFQARKLEQVSHF